MALPVSLIPGAVGELVTALIGADAIYSDFVYGYDFAIGGLPFVSAADAENPIRRKSIPIEKPRTDDSPEPGEQTFGNWWVKAQSSLHGGAGLKYTDSSDSFDRIRFRKSSGVDVWTPGQVKLLAGAESVLEDVEAGVVVAARDTVTLGNLLFCQTGAGFTIRKATYTVDGNGVDQVSYSTIDTVVTATDPISVTTDGTVVYTILAAGVYKTVVASGVETTTRIYTGAYVAGDLVGFVKGRLILCKGRAVYELDQAAGVDTALPVAKFTHQTTGWVWTAIADGPNAIYVAGNVGDSGSIYKFVLDTQGVFPTLTSGMVACELPPSEKVTGMLNYVGFALAVTTNAGLRFGQFDGSQVALGPLTIDHRDDVGTVGTRLTAYGRYVYCSFTDLEGYAGAARVDMGMMLTDSPYRFVQENIFAWAPDALYEDSTNGFVSGTVSGLTVQDGRLVIGVSTEGVAHVHPSRLRPSGTVVTSRIRMGTLEDKNARFIRVRAESSYGYLGYAIGYEADSVFTGVGTITLADALDSGDQALSSDPSGWVTLKFTLTSSDIREDRGPVMSGYQLKCVPSVAKQRRFQIPVLVFDEEFSRTGEALPYLGRAIDRIRAVETVESTGNIVEFATLALDGIERERVLIEDVDFIQARGPYEHQGFGGIMILTMKTVR